VRLACYRPGVTIGCSKNSGLPRHSEKEIVPD
jgi:hypothetical protein